VNGERRSNSYHKRNGLMVNASTTSGSQTYNFRRRS
jgi:hypothetical protein